MDKLIAKVVKFLEFGCSMFITDVTAVGAGQSSYSVYVDQGSVGDRYDVGEHDIVSMVNPVDTIFYGRGVVKLSGNAKGVRLPTLNSDVFEGVALRDIGNPYPGYYNAKSAIPVLKMGRCFVEVSETVTPDGVLLMEVDSSGAHVAGRFCITADGAHTMAITSARLELINSFVDKDGVKVALINVIRL